MEPTHTFTEQIDAYLLGTMPEHEQQAFVQQAEKDPLLAQELRLQQEILGGLRRARVAQLKANLNQLPTTPVGGGFAPSTWMAVAVGSVAVVAAGVALYLNMGSDDARKNAGTTPKVEVASAPIQATAPSVQAVSTKESDKNTSGQTSLTQSDPTAQVGGQSATKSASGSLSTPKDDYKSANLSVVLPKVEKAKPLNPDQPNEEADDNSLIERQGIGSLPSGKVIEVNEITEKPSVVIGTADVLSYKYLENKIYLYGSFGDAIYELMELTTAEDGRRLYVYFKENFYAVSKDVREITPMKAIVDPKLIAELTLLRKKKAE